MGKRLKGIKENEHGEFEVRLNFLGKRYPVVNYSKKYNCRNIDEVEDQIKEFKRLLTKGDNPFANEILGDYYDKYFKKVSKKGTKSSYNYKKMYDKYAKEHLHQLNLSDISEMNIEWIYEDMVEAKDANGNFVVNSKSTLTKMKTILSPVFKNLTEAKKIDKNYLTLAEVPDLDRHVDLISLTMRLKDQDYVEVVRKLYKSIQKVKNVRSRMYLLFTLMTARRKEETFKITKEHINNDVVNVYKNMTKSKIDERFIIPHEIQNYIENVDNELVLKCVVHKYLDDWKDVLKDANIDYLQTFRVYDVRHLFTSIMKKKFNRDLVGACISHYKGDTNEIYASYEFEDRKSVMREWWKILRDE